MAQPDASTPRYLEAKRALLETLSDLKPTELFNAEGEALAAAVEKRLGILALKEQNELKLSARARSETASQKDRLREIRALVDPASSVPADVMGDL